MIPFCLALASVAFWPTLPHPLWVALALLLVPLIYRRSRLVPKGHMQSLAALPLGRWSAWALLGIAWGMTWGHWQLAHRLPVAQEKVDLRVVGVVVGLSQKDDDICRLELAVKRWPDEGFFHPRRLRLNWYRCERLPRPGELWRFEVRLKRPHGYRNPGGFDREGYLLARGIDATGYVRAEPAPEYQGRSSWQGRWDRWRWELARQQLAEDTNGGGALTNALLFGDRRHLSDAQWEALRRTGTLHLFVVSGMHIGLVALNVFALVRALGRLVPRARLHHRQWLALGIALGVSLGYAALAGFALPTQRAWIMVALLMLGWVSWQSRPHWQRLLLAATAVLIWDPLAIRSAGFWLSFSAAAILLWAFAGKRPGAWPRALVRAQWAAFLGISPWLLLAFHQLAPLAPLINLAAIPLVTLVLLPLALSGLVLSLAAMPGGDWVLAQAVALMGWLDQALRIIADYSPFWNPGPLSLGAVLLASLGSLLLLCPRPLPGRWLGLVLWLPLLRPEVDLLAQGTYRVTVFDVGQGTAVLVETRDRRLLYDTGPRYASGFAAARVAILPYLRAQGIEHLDRLVVSHGDSDHAGGLPLLREHLSLGRLISGEPEVTGGALCAAGSGWRWSGVDFRFLHPAPDFGGDSNNRSCVLRIAGPGGVTLLLGDIENAVERRLLTEDAEALDSDLLLAAHHGSRSSSSRAFVEAVAPRAVIFSSGYRNRYGHPHEDVVTSFQDVGAATLATASEGAVQWTLGATGLRRTGFAAGLSRRYWRP